MTDVTTQKLLRVLSHGTVWPSLDVPFVQLEEVQRLLDGHGINYEVEENVVSIDGGPEYALVWFDRGADEKAIQTVLDSVR
jgi:hypothetical protein